MAKKQNLFDETGKKSELHKGKPVYRWRGLPSEGHYSETIWNQLGYKPKDKDEFTCWVQSNDNKDYYKIYSIDDVVPMSGKGAAARRDIYQRFKSISSQDLYKRMLGIYRSKKHTDVDKAIGALCGVHRKDIVDNAHRTYRLTNTTTYDLRRYFIGWVNMKRMFTWRNKMVDRICRMEAKERGVELYRVPNWTISMEFDNRQRDGWQ